MLVDDGYDDRRLIGWRTHRLPNIPTSYRH